jgi:hypothetical protein
VLATGGHEPQAFDAGTGGRQRPGASHRAFLAPDPEAIPVGAIGGQPGHLDMDRVGQFGMGQCLALRDERLEARVPGHFPAHRDRPWLHPAQGFERSGREPGPEHETVTGRIARGHPQRERIGPEPRVCQQVARHGAFLREGGQRPAPGKAYGRAKTDGTGTEQVKGMTSIERAHGTGVPLGKDQRMIRWTKTLRP